MPKYIGDCRFPDADLAKPYCCRVSEIVHVQIAKSGELARISRGRIAHLACSGLLALYPDC